MVLFKFQHFEEEMPCNDIIKEDKVKAGTYIYYTVIYVSGKRFTIKNQKVNFLPSFVENPMLDNGRAAACSLCSPLSLFNDPGATL